MKKYKRLIFSMFISIFISIGIISLLNFGCQENNTYSTISNIFIGILGSSFVTLLGYFFEYFSYKKEYKNNVLDCYREVRIKIIPFLHSFDDDMVNKIMNKDIIYRIRALRSDRLKYLNILDKICKTRVIEKYEIRIDNILPQYMKALYVLSMIHDYFTLRNTYLYIQNFLKSEYDDMYQMLKDCFTDEEIKEQLQPTIEAIDLNKENKKKMKTYWEESPLSFQELCRELDQTLIINAK